MAWKYWIARSMPLVTTIARAWPPILLSADHLLVEVVDHDLGLEPDGMVVALDVAAQLLAAPAWCRTPDRPRPS